ncbi:MAG: CoA transferase [Clostridiales bacterium]|nr:CoA transferase [Clostridiales bacterium]
MANLLDGVIIVACELAEAGPAATQALGILGATVYHVDRPKSVYPPLFKDQTNEGTVLRNSNKYSLGIDCKTEQGKELLWKLVEKADVFMENFAPGAWERMGFSYEEVKKRNPEIIYVYVKGFAKASRWANSVTIDPVACAASGAIYMNGYEDYMPMMCGVNIGDSGAAIHSAAAIAAAILQKKLTGKGQYLEAVMQYAALNCGRNAFVNYYMNDKKYRRPGNGFRGLEPTGPWNVYPVQGEDMQGNYVAITCRADEKYKDFEHLCVAMNREDLLKDPRYATAELRYQNRILLDAEITKWTLCRKGDEVLQILGVEGNVPVGKVNSIADVAADPFLNNGDGVLQICEDKELPKDLLMPTIPVKVKGAPTLRAITCGDTGAHDYEVLHGHLGISDEEYQKLVDDKIIDP